MRVYIITQSSSEGHWVHSVFADKHLARQELAAITGEDPEVDTYLCVEEVVDVP